MENFDTATDSAADALNSSGSAMRENEKYLDSYEAKLNIVKNTWTETTMALQEDVLGDGILIATSVATGFIKVLTVVIDKVGLLETVLGTVGIAFALFNKRLAAASFAASMGLWNSFLGVLRSLDTGFRNVTAGSEGTSRAMTVQTIQTRILTAATTGLTVAGRALMTVFLPMAAMMAVGWGISKLVGAFTSAKKASDELEESMKKTNEANIKAVTSNKDQVDGLLASYKEMSAERPEAGFDNVEKEQEYLDVVKNLSEEFPALISHIDTKGRAHLKNAEAIDQEIAAAKELSQAEREEKIEEVTDGFGDRVKDLKEYQKEVETLEHDIQRWKQAIQNAEDDPNLGIDVDYLKGLIDEGTHELIMAQSKVSNVTGEFAGEVIEVFKLLSATLGEEVIPEIQDSILQLLGSMDFKAMNKDGITEFTEELGVLAKELNDLYEAGDDQGFATKQAELNKFAGTIDDAINPTDLLATSIEEVSEKIETQSYLREIASKITDDAVDGIENEIDLQKLLSEEYDKSISGIKELNGVLNELDDGQGLSADSIGLIMEKYEEFLPYLEDEVALREAIEDAVINEGQTATEVIAQKLMLNEEYFTSLVNGNSELYQNIAGLYQGDLGKFSSLAQAKAAIEQQLIQSLAGAWGDYYRVASNGLLALNMEAHNMVKAYEGTAAGKMFGSFNLKSSLHGDMYEANNKLKEMQAGFDAITVNSIDVDLNGITQGLDRAGRSAKGAGGAAKDAGKKAKKAGDQASKAAKDAEKATKDAEKAQEEYNKSLERSVYIADKYANSLREIDSILENHQHAQHGMVKHSKEYRDSLREEIKLQEKKGKIIKDQQKSISAQIASGKMNPTGEIITTHAAVASGGSSGGSGSSSGTAVSGWGGRVSSKYGMRNGKMHQGIDIAGAGGTPVSSPVSGSVVAAGTYGKGSGYNNYGNVVAIKSGSDVHILAHLSKVLVKTGANVSKGQIIGNIGSTGRSSGNHIHYEIRKNGQLGNTIDPTGYANDMRGSQGKVIAASSGGGGGSGAHHVKSGYTGKYASTINKASAQYGVDANLIAAIIKQESNFNANARSGAGAQGLMQLMPATARGLGVKNSLDPTQNIMGGTKYIAQMIAQFGGDLKMGLAAYNAGPGNVKKYGGIPPFKETQNYIPKVMANYEAYGGASSPETSKYMAENAQSLDAALSTQSQLGSAHLAHLKRLNELHEGIADAKIAEFDSLISGVDRSLQKSSQKLLRLDSSSHEYRKELSEQVKHQSYKQDLLHKEANFMREQMKNQNISTEYKQKLIVQTSELSLAWWDVQEAIQAVNQSIVESRSTQFSRLQGGVDRSLQKSDYNLGQMGTSTKGYQDELAAQIKHQEYKQRMMHQEAQFLREQIKNEKHSDDYKQELIERTSELSLAWWGVQEAIQASNFEIMKSKISSYTELIGGVDRSLEKMSLQLQYYEEGGVAYLEVLNEEIKKQEYKQRLIKDQQKYIQGQLASGKLTVEQQKEMVIEASNLELQFWQVENAITSINKTLKDTSDKIADDIVNSMKAMYEQRKQMALDANNKIMKAEDERHKKVMDGYRDELTAFEKLVNAKLREIDDDYDEETFDKDLAKMQKERGETQERIDELYLDDSYEATSKRLDLEKQLAEQIEAISEFRSDRERKLAKDDLNDRLDDFKEDMEAKEKAEDYKHDKTKESLEKERKEIEYHYNEILKNERMWTKVREEIAAGGIDNVGKIIKEFLLDMDGMNEETIDAFGSDWDKLLVDMENLNEKTVKDMSMSWQELLNIMDEARKSMDKYENQKSPSDKTPEDGTESDRIKAMKENSKNWAGATPSERLEMVKENEIWGKELGATYDKGTGVWVKDGQHLYHSDEDQRIIDIMADNAKRWADADADEKIRLSKENALLGKEIGATRHATSGTWYKDGLQILRSQSDKDIVDLMRQNANAWQSADSGERTRLSDDNKKLGKSINATLDKSTGKWYRGGLQLFHKGGIVGDKTNRLTELANNMFNAKPSEQVIKSLKGELQIPPQNIPNIFGSISSLIGSMTTGGASDSGVVINQMDVSIAQLDGGEKGAKDLFAHIDKSFVKRGMRR